MFFWHFQNRHIANKQRTVIWLNGGPGCSSEDGALMEIGPYRLKDDHTLEYNDGSWNEFANVMFVDNPVGTGFSYVNTDSYLHELDEMANQFVIFLDKWFALFPEYEHDDVSLPSCNLLGHELTITTSFTSQGSPTPDSTSPTSPRPSWHGTSFRAPNTNGSSRVFSSETAGYRRPSSTRRISSSLMPRASSKRAPMPRTNWTCSTASV